MERGVSETEVEEERKVEGSHDSPRQRTFKGHTYTPRKPTSSARLEGHPHRLVRLLPRSTSVRLEGKRTPHRRVGPKKG